MWFQPYRYCSKRSPAVNKQYGYTLAIHHLMSANRQETHGICPNPFVNDADIAGDGKCPFAFKLFVKTVVA